MDSRRMMLSIGLMLCIVSLAILVVTTLRQWLSLRHIPGPWYAGWSNLMLKSKVMGGRRSQYIHSLHQKHGHFVRISPNEIAVSDLSAVKTVHRVGSTFRKSPWYQTFNKSAHPGIFSMTDPKQHSARRRLFAQSFSNTSLLDFENLVRQKVDTAVAKIKRDAKAGNSDILKWWTFMATDMIGEMSFGRSFDMLEQEDKTAYIRDLETTMLIGGMRAEMEPLFTIAEKLPIKRLQHVLKLNDRLNAYGAAAIENHRMHLARAGGGSFPTLFAKFLDPGKNQELSLPEIAAEAGNLIVAGSDTTAISITYLVWAVLRPQHSAVRERLLREMESLPLNADFTRIRTLKYLRAVVDESLRLYGAAPGSLPRVTPPEGANLGDYVVPGGTTVSTQAYTLHRDAGIFAEPDCFVPERWINPTQQMKDAYMPFGAGARVCLGIHLALMEMVIATFVFFKTCPTARLATSTNDASMEFEDFFLIAPISHRCEITM